MNDASEPPRRPLVPQGTSSLDEAPRTSKRDIALRIAGLGLGVLAMLTLASAAISLVLVGLIALTCSK